jgi:D-sedoheptulose 7-phosphate isomerase
MRQGAKNAKLDENVAMIRGGYYVGKGSLVASGFCGQVDAFFYAIAECLARTEVTGDGWFTHNGTLQDSITKLRKYFRDVHKRGGKLIFVGNGGSAAIASHMAVDYTKNGGIRAIALNDAPTLTCLANDFGYENVFAKQLEYYATYKDVVVIVSSSGKSENILRAAKMCDSFGLGEKVGDGIDCHLVTFSGMNPANHLRRVGDLNFYVPAADYGLVELSHLCILHSVVSAK